MRIMFVGDLNLGEFYTSFGHGPKTYARTNDLFSGVHHILEKADIVVGNLEGPISSHNQDESRPQSVVFRGEPEVVSQLASAGFKVIQVANNHTLQHGTKCFIETVDILEKNGIFPVGCFGEELVKINLNGHSIGFVAASDVPDNTDDGQRLYNRLTDEFFQQITIQINEVDFLIVLLHWGDESSTSALPYQKELMEKFRAIGVTAVVGSHPHLFYEVENNGPFLVAYSLGNFIFDVCWDKRYVKSGILDMEIINGNIKANIWPVTLQANGCKPSISGEPIEVINNVKLYDLGKSMSWQYAKKNFYFFKNIFLGNTILKLKFYFHKLISKLA